MSQRATLQGDSKRRLHSPVAACRSHALTWCRRAAAAATPGIVGFAAATALLLLLAQAWSAEPGAAASSVSVYPDCIGDNLTDLRKFLSKHIDGRPTHSLLH